MADYLLDTNIIEYWYKTHCQQHAGLMEWLSKVRTPDPDTGYISRLYISVVTLAEIEHSHRANPALGETTEAEYNELISRELPPALEVTSAVVKPYGLLRAWLFKNCAPTKKRGKKWLEDLRDPATGKELQIDVNDLWIVSQAAALNLVLITGDKMEPLREAAAAVTPELRIENWAKSETTR